MGDGETPVVLVPGFVSNVDLFDDPTWQFNGIFERIGASSRFVAWDKRGTGLSDPVDHVPTLDERMDDLHAVLDAAGIEKPALWGISEGGPMSVLFAATYPERVRSMVLYGTVARFSQELPDVPWGAHARAVHRDTGRDRRRLGGRGLGRDLLRLRGRLARFPGDVGQAAAGVRKSADGANGRAGAHGHRCEGDSRFGANPDVGPRPAR
jgi:pimeloyl-ACP methyl ester carboxylesterase